MDPNALLEDIAELLAESASDSLAADGLVAAVADLKEWIDRGGFHPTYSRFPVAAAYFKKATRTVTPQVPALPGMTPLGFKVRP